MRVLIIDSDILVYSVIFACADEEEWWKVQWTAKKVMENLCALSKCSHYVGYLTDSKSNFRLPRATTWPYKGERETNKEKPAWYQEVREFYQEHYGFQVMYGIEADDALTIAAEHYASKGIPVACATKDKDLKQYPWDVFVDMNTDTVYSISPEDSHRNFWKQMLLGDVAVDNIPGLSHAAKYGTTVEFNKLVRGNSEMLVGKAKAEKLLDLWDPEDYPKNVYEMYVDWYGDDLGNTQAVIDTCDTQGITFGEYRFYETFSLVYMLRACPSSVKINYKYREIPEGKLGQVANNEFDDCTEEEF